MKPHLRLMGMLCPDKKLSAIGCQLSESSSQRSAMSYQLLTRIRLLPKTYYLIPRRELSAVSNQPSEFGRFTQFIGKLIPKTYHLIPNKELSAVSGQLSDTIRYVRVVSRLIPKTQYLLPIFFLVFVSCSAVLAQELVGNTAPAAKAETEITPLKIGDRVPDELWEMYFPVVSTASDQGQYLSLGDFKDKLIILDFWATWCSPCVAMIPKMDSLQKVFGDKMQFLSVTYQKKGEVLPFLAKLEQVKEQKYHLPVLTDDEHLRFVFPHRELPHYVWIQNGIIQSISEYGEVTNENITNALLKKDFSFKKKDEIVNVHSVQNNENEEPSAWPIYRSELKGYQPGLPGKYDLYWPDSIKGRTVEITNVPLITLYLHAFSLDSDRIMQNSIFLEVEKPELLSSSLQGQAYSKWLADGHGYSYSLTVPFFMSDQLSSLMKQDLKRFFSQYNADLEKRTKPFYSAYVEDKELIENFRSQGGEPSFFMDAFQLDARNQKFSRVIDHLKKTMLQQLPYPLIDETLIDFNIDIEVNGVLSDISTFQKALKPYGINIELKEGEVEALVIKDSK